MMSNRGPMLLRTTLLSTLIVLSLDAMTFEEWKEYRHTEAYEKERLEAKERRDKALEFQGSMKENRIEEAPRSSRPVPTPVLKQEAPVRQPASAKRANVPVSSKQISQFRINDRNRVLSVIEKELLERVIQKEYLFHSAHLDLPASLTLPLTIIASRKAYLNYLRAEGVTSANETAGVFLKASQQTVVWKQPNYYGTIIHEAQHYLLNTNFPNAPLWLNEGLSEYYERAYIREGGIYVSQSELQKQLIAKWLRSGDIRLIRNVITMPDREWWALHKGPEYKSRVVSWGIVYFLMSTEENRKLFSQMIRMLRNNEGTTLEVINKIYRGGINRFSRDWFAFFEDVPPTIKL